MLTLIQHVISNSFVSFLRHKVGCMGCLSAFPFRKTEDLLPQPLGEQAVDSYQLSFSPGARSGLRKASLSKGGSHLMAAWLM